MGRASGGSNTPHWTRTGIHDFLRAMSVKMEGSATRRRWERDFRELVRFGLLMRRIALDWTLSRRLREDLGAPPRT